MDDFSLIAIEPLEAGGELISFAHEPYWGVHLVSSAVKGRNWCHPGKHYIDSKVTHCSVHNLVKKDSRQYLRLNADSWYCWPLCTREKNQRLEVLYDSFKVREKYTQFSKTGLFESTVQTLGVPIAVTSKGAAKRCVFCHENLEEKLHALCSLCGSTFHLHCTKEMPGCHCEDSR